MASISAACAALYDVYRTLIAVCDVAAKMVITQGRLSVRCSNRYDSDIKPQFLVAQTLKHSQSPRRLIIVCNRTGFLSSVAINGLIARLGQPFEHYSMMEHQCKSKTLLPCLST
ncbi:hypothetical protein CY34DRAFT_238465 [Suillus luteus UH-Slu-Lm8-n1]|uniref:Uncharacterized protein n=1 Tax=Suillus luteus UH-Slu-Lm8-n1 TaxID=930992 RepID=A0A0D0AGS7_9AGAM|nr:hypothetical protein CY34DRAFT_238465 [Suillus luteus UH-Slu-Lm8-n1]